MVNVASVSSLGSTNAAATAETTLHLDFESTTATTIATTATINTTWPSNTINSQQPNSNELYLLWSITPSYLAGAIPYSLLPRDDRALDDENVATTLWFDSYEGDVVESNYNDTITSFNIQLSNSTEENLETIIGPVHDPYTTVVLMTIVYVFILITGVTGNLLTCLVIARKRYMHTATNYYLFSLAVSDLLLLILGLPHDLVLLWQKYPYMFSESFCILRGLTSELSTNASILTITAFTIERYVAICHPLRSHTTLKLARVVKTIVIIWIIGALCAAPIAYQFGIVYVHDELGQAYPNSDHCTVKRPLYEYIFEIATMVFFVVPICIITILYILIGIRLRASSKSSSGGGSSGGNGLKQRGKCVKFGRQMDKTPGSGGGGGWQRSGGGGAQEGRAHLSMSIRRQNASRRAVIKMLVAVVISFFFCYSPFHAQRVLAIVLARNKVSEGSLIEIFNIMTHISGVTYYLSSTINPILYQVMSKKFQLALRETLPCCKKFQDDYNDADIAYSTGQSSVAHHHPKQQQQHPQQQQHHQQNSLSHNHSGSGSSGRQASFRVSNSPRSISLND